MKHPFPIKTKLLNLPTKSRTFEITMMKCASLLAVLPAAAVAFQNTAPIHRVSPTPGIVTLGDRAGENQTPGLLTLVDRADECAIHYGFCDIDELETLADGEQRRVHLKIFYSSPAKAEDCHSRSSIRCLTSYTVRGAQAARPGSPESVSDSSHAERTQTHDGALCHGRRARWSR